MFLMMYLCNNVECVIKVIVSSVRKTGHKIGYINSLVTFQTGCVVKVSTSEQNDC